MTALAAGTKVPDVELKTMDGKKFSLQAQLARGPVVVVFFKVSCPTCQYVLPMFERLHQEHRHAFEAGRHNGGLNRV